MIPDSDMNEILCLREIFQKYYDKDLGARWEVLIKRHKADDHLITRRLNELDRKENPERYDNF